MIHATPHPGEPATSTPDAPALRVRNLWKVFGAPETGFSPDQLAAHPDWVPAVHDASFEVQRGEVFVIMGLSGSGKSTLLRCLTRLIEPTSGAVQFGGLDVLTADEAALRDLRRRAIGMVFQNFALLPNLTLRDNIAFPLRIRKDAPASIDARVLELIELVNLTGYERRFPAELSGGQQQRIGIARSLATDPAYWFLDEPFSALDPLIRAELQDEVIRLQRSLHKTVVFVTHDLDEAIRIADRIAIMQNGRIVQIGTPGQLVTNPADDYVRRFVAKIHPARVLTAASVMTPRSEDTVTGPIIPQTATVESFAPQLVTTTGPLFVSDASGAIVGIINRPRALAALARTEPPS